MSTALVDPSTTSHYHFGAEIYMHDQGSGAHFDVTVPPGHGYGVVNMPSILAARIWVEYNLGSITQSDYGKLMWHLRRIERW